MDFEGRFVSPDDLVSVLRRVSDESLSGVMILRCGVMSVATFYFYNGQLSGSENPERHRRLGRILLNRGLIDRSGLDEALAYQADFAPGTPIGKVLVHHKKLSQDELAEAVRIQIEDELASALDCLDGFYQFNATQSNEGEPPLVLLDTKALLDETVGRQKEWTQIRAKVPNDSVIPKVVKLDGPSDREVLHLTTREWHVLSLINGYYDVGCISVRSGLGRFETYKVLENLLTSGVIQLLQPKEPVNQPAMDEEGNAMPPADNNSDSRAAGSSSSRWGSLLARLREDGDNGNGTRSPDTTMLHFDSPVSFLAEVANQVLDKLMTNPDFVANTSDERLAEVYWRQVLMTFPKADLVAARMNIMDATDFDRYTRTLGVDGPMHSIYLDTVDALSRFIRTIYLLSAQRLGSKAARTLFVDVMENIKSRSTIANSESFFFKELAAEVLA